MAHICTYIYGFYRDCIPIFPIPTTSKFDSKSFSSRPGEPTSRDLMLLYDPMSLEFLMSAHSALIPRP